MIPQGPGGIFSQMTQPSPELSAGVTPPTPTTNATRLPTPTSGQPQNLGQLLAALAQRNQQGFQPAASYRSQLSLGGLGTHEMNNTHDKYALKGILGLMGSNPFNLDAFHDSNGLFDETQFNEYNSIGGVPLFSKNEAGDWMINPNGRYGELNNQFKGLDFRIEKDPYNDMKPTLRYNENALPRDAFGGFGAAQLNDDGSLADQMHLRNADMVYEDPFYGRITHPQNMYQEQNWFDKFNDMLGPILLSVVAGGLGSALGGAGLLGGGLKPATLLGIGQGASGAMGGDYGRILQSIIGAGLPMAGLSGLPLQLARTGTGFFTNMLNNRGGRG